MNPLKFWQSLLAVLWVGAILAGGYYIYDSFFGSEPCPIYIPGSKSCAEARGGIQPQQNNLLQYDVTSPLGKALLEKDRLGFPPQLR